jgi:hypothetical protein
MAPREWYDHRSDFAPALTEVEALNLVFRLSSSKQRSG